MPPVRWLVLVAMTVVASACGPAWRPVATASAVPGAKGQGFVRPAESEWTSCQDDDECHVVKLGGAGGYCADTRGVMAVRHDSTRMAITRYGASDREILDAPIDHVTCRPLRAGCVAGHCTLLEQVP